MQSFIILNQSQENTIPDMEISAAGENDFPAISTLAKEIWHAHYPDIISQEQIEYMLEKMYSPHALKEQMLGGHQFFILKMHGLPAGYLSYSQTSPASFFLHKLYVKSLHQRKGLGHFLLKKLEDVLPADYQLRLTVNRKNFKAINFYFRCGFSIESTADFDIGEGFFMNDFIMLKKAEH